MTGNVAMVTVCSFSGRTVHDSVAAEGFELDW